MLFFVILIFFFLVILYWFVHSNQYPKNFPPGPRHFVPFIGDPLFAIGSDAKAGIARMHKKYGPIVGYNFGGKKLVSFSNLDTLQKILSQDIYSNRPSQEGFNDLRHGVVSDGSSPGILSSNGQNWKEMRRFTLQTLRDFGFGKRSMEGIIEDEFAYLSRTLELSRGNPVEIMDLFNVPVLNVLWRILTGERFKAEDPKLTRTMVLIEKFIADCGSPLSFLGFTSTKRLWILETLGLLRVRKGVDAIFQIVDEEIADHEATFQEDNMRDFIDCFIDKKMPQDDSPVKQKDAKQNLRNIFLDLFLAGSETTSSTLKWAVLFMVLNQDVQSKLQEELDDVIESNHGSSLTELRTKLPYTEAVLLEVQRIGNVVPTALFHTTTTATTIENYAIPGGTQIIPLLTAVHFDPEAFPEPHQFNPQRYIDGNGNFVPHPNIVPFGVGKRRCLGESLAKVELFTFFANLMHKFEIRPVNENEKPSTKYRPGVTLSPMPFKARFVARN